jgi:phage replication O-like protein O
MANPQKEEGYTPIANEIMEALCRTRIPGEERQVLDAILRKTYGWNKCEDHISLGQIAELTEMKRPNVARGLKNLLTKKIVTVIKSDNTGINLLKFNKNYDQWVLSKTITGNGVIESDNRTVIKTDNKSVIKSDTHKRKKEKKTIPPCPHNQIIDAYNSILGSHLPLVKIKLWPGTSREKSLSARWGEDEARRTDSFWTGLFEYIRDKCPFLLGDNDKQWKADLEWILKKNYFVKILEGKYERR